MRTVFLYGGLLALLLLAVGCSTESPQSTFDAAGYVSKSQLTLFWIIFWAAAFVFVVVEGLLLYTVIRYRWKKGQAEPKQIHGNHKLELLWTIAPAIVLAVIAVPTVMSIFELHSPPDEETLEITVVGHQWFWEFEYPDLGIKTSNELHIPTGKVVNLTLNSNDVLHSFWVPKLAGKQDIIPTRSNELWLIADEPGVYFGQCAEFCGVAHAQMRFRVIAESPSEFDKWTKDFLRPSVAPKGMASEGAKLFNEKGCIACHTIQDNPIARGNIGPSLTHFGLRNTIAAGLLEKDEFGENLTKWLTDPEEVKPGNIMSRDGVVYNDAKMAMTNKDVAALVIYLNGLKPDTNKEPITPGSSAGPSIGLGEVPEPESGDEANGEALFTSLGCSACHSIGTDALIGPGMAGLADRASGRVEDLSVGQYIYQSIVDPSAFVVSDFPDNVMPQVFADMLTDEELNDLVEYLKSLK